MLRSHVLPQTARSSFDPTQGASQVGYREISGNIPSTKHRLALTAWAIVFANQTQASERYTHIVHLLGDVGANGLIREPIEGVLGDTFGNMSERTDLLGKFSTIWITSLAGSNSAHGAVLASTGGRLVQILATNIYIATLNDRAIYVLEELARRMAARERDLRLSPESDTMARLPILVDTFGLLDNAAINVNRYESGPQA